MDYGSEFRPWGLLRCEDILRVDATPFEGFEETVQTFEALQRCLRTKKEWFEFVSTVGEEPFWQADIQKIQATAQVSHPFRRKIYTLNRGGVRSCGVRRPFHSPPAQCYHNLRCMDRQA